VYTLRDNLVLRWYGGAAGVKPAIGPPAVVALLIARIYTRRTGRNNYAAEIFQ
jgi:hypothetical protein